MKKRGSQEKERDKTEKEEILRKDDSEEALDEEIEPYF